jgi:hypothetical protein
VNNIMSFRVILTAIVLSPVLIPLVFFFWLLSITGLGYALANVLYKRRAGKEALQRAFQ